MSLVEERSVALSLDLLDLRPPVCQTPLEKEFRQPQRDYERSQKSRTRSRKDSQCQKNPHSRIRITRLSTYVLGRWLEQEFGAEMYRSDGRHGVLFDGWWVVARWGISQDRRGIV